MKLTLHPAQKAFRESASLYRGFVGGRGAGKSYVGALDLLLRADKQPGLYQCIAPTYPMLKDASLRSFKALGQQLGILKKLNRGTLVAELRNGSEVVFKSADEPDRLRGPNISGAWLDEASLMTSEVYEVVIASLREGGRQGWLSATFTPKGRIHWTFAVFGEGAADTELFHAKTADNPWLPPTFAETIRRQYTAALAAQELEGDFIDAEGVLFSRAWFPVVDAAPAKLSRIRAWDLAGTEAKKGADPDWTVGLLLGRDPHGAFYVLDVRRLRATPANVEQVVGQCASEDGRNVAIYIEQEPGSSGQAVISSYIRALAGWTVRGERSTGAKSTRAQPLAAQAEAGNVRLLRGPWNRAFLDEIEVFPLGRHDDQVDAASLAFSKLTARALGSSRAVPAVATYMGRGLPVTSPPGALDSDWQSKVMNDLAMAGMRSVGPRMR